jgi:hypothetical protein
LLEWRSRTQGRIEGQIVGFTAGGARLYVTTALTLGASLRATPGMPAGDPVDRVGNFARGERLSNLDFLTAIPPVGAERIEDILFGGFGGRLFRLFGFAYFR